MVHAGGQQSASFPRTARVLAAAGFERVFKSGRRTAMPQLALHVLADDGMARLGLVVSRKVDKRAVGRNRIKRVIREWFRQVRAQLAPGAYVVVARAGAAQADNAGLRAVLATLAVRAGVMHPAAAGHRPPPSFPSPPPCGAPH